MFEPARLKTKQAERSVTIELRDGRRVSGTMTMKPRASVESLLTGGSPFVSVATAEGEVAFHRDFITAVLINDETGADADEPITERWSAEGNPTFDPCRILQVKPGATADEIKTAWRNRMRACHPDSVRGKGYSEEVIQAAQQQAQMVNHAYETLMGLRRK
ncbi:MAG: J domain-containing protein [Pseudomonadota bacterium]